MAVCRCGIEHLDHAAPFCAGLVPGQAEIADQLVEPPEAAHVLVLVVLGELDEQDRLGIAAHDRVDGGLEHRDLAREAQHGAVDQLDRDRPELDDVLRGIHRRQEAAEMAGADGAPAEQRRKLELDPGGECERALGADQDMREVEIVAAGHQRVEIVAADPALHLREMRFDRVGLARGDAPAGRARAARAATAAAGRRGRARPDRNARARRPPAPRRSRARSRGCCRSAASARRRNCCRPCRRWWRARRWRCRPETTGHAASAGD